MYYANLSGGGKILQWNSSLLEIAFGALLVRLRHIILQSSNFQSSSKLKVQSLFKLAKRIVSGIVEDQEIEGAQDHPCLPWVDCLPRRTACPVGPPAP